MADETPLIDRVRAWAKDAAASGNQIMADTLNETADELEDWEKCFDLFAAANQRATRMWQAAHPTEIATLPDQGKMIDWLCDSLRDALNELEAARKK